jgi:putative membrane protein
MAGKSTRLLALHWLVYAAVLMLIARFVPGFQIQGFGSALLAVVIIGIVNATLGLLLKLITLPLSVITHGLFVFVIDAFVIRMSSAMVPGFAVAGFEPAFIAALILAVIQMLLDSVRIETQSGGGPHSSAGFSITLSLRRP